MSDKSAPTVWAACYSLHAYCDMCSQLYEIAGRNQTECILEARVNGWIMRPKERTARCVNCQRKAVAERYRKVPAMTLPATLRRMK